MIQDHPILNLLKTVRGRVRWVGHGRKPPETCLMGLGWSSGSVKTENRFHSNRRHHRHHHHHYSTRRRSSCRFHSCDFVNHSSRHSALARIASGCSGCALGGGPFTCAPPRRSVSWSTIASPRRPLCLLFPNPRTRAPFCSQIPRSTEPKHASLSVICSSEVGDMLSLRIRR
jgi:hypothetical protein